MMIGDYISLLLEMGLADYCHITIQWSILLRKLFNVIHIHTPVMNIYMINTGSQYTLYYNPPKQEPKAAAPKRHCIDLASRIENAEGERAGLTTREFRITADLGDSIAEAYKELSGSVKEKLQKIGSRMRTKVSGILKDAAYAGTANLNYSAETPEEIARCSFSRIVKKEQAKSLIILGASIAVYAASYVPLLFVAEQPLLGPIVGFAPLWPIIGPIVGYQIAVMRTLRKGMKNISFVSNPDVTKLERIIAGEQGLGLTNPDLIEYRVTKGL